MEPNDKDPKDVDVRLSAESKRLLSEMNRLIARGRLLLRDREQARASDEPALRVLPGTLGAVLYARPPQTIVSENDWASLLRSVAARDAFALHALCERAQGVVATLILRITGRPEIAEELTVDVFHEIWRQAERYDASQGSVLGWIMNLARARAVDARGDAKRGGSTGSSAGISAPSLQALLARRIAVDTGGKPVLPAAGQWIEPEWEQVAPGISVKLYATDTEKQMVSMLVRLAPRADYPSHTHAGVEELHLLEGELWIDERKLYPGDYNRAEPGTGDNRVWSETGCTCVLMTSTKDVLR